MRILVLIAIGLLLYIILGGIFRRARAGTLIAEKMVKCDQCGLHVIEREAVRQGDHYFCTTQHLEDFNTSK